MTTSISPAQETARALTFHLSARRREKTQAFSYQSRQRETAFATAVQLSAPQEETALNLQLLARLTDCYIQLPARRMERETALTFIF